MGDQESDLLQFIYQIPVGVAQIQPDGAFGLANPTAMQICLQIAPGLTNIFDILRTHAPEVEQLVSDFAADRGTIVEDYRVDFGKRAPNAPFSLVVSFTVRKLGPERLMLVMEDVSRSVAAHRAAEASQVRLNALTESIRDFAVITLDADAVVREWPPSAERVFGRAAADTVGQFMGTLSKKSDDFVDALSLATETGTVSVNAWWRREDGSMFWGRAVISVLQCASGEITGYLAVVKDQSAERSQSKDDLGLLPREAFDQVARRLLEDAIDHGRQPSFALVLCDHSPDTLLHRRQVLKSVLATLREHLEPNDAVVGFSSDALLVVLADAPLAQAKARLERIRNAQERHVFSFEDAIHQVTLSIGVASVEPAETDPHPALAQAEVALASAVERGCNQVVVGHPKVSGRRAV